MSFLLAPNCGTTNCGVNLCPSCVKTSVWYQSANFMKIPLIDYVFLRIGWQFILIRKVAYSSMKGIYSIHFSVTNTTAEGNYRGFQCTFLLSCDQDYSLSIFI